MWVDGIVGWGFWNITLNLLSLGDIPYEEPSVPGGAYQVGSDTRRGDREPCVRVEQDILFVPRYSLCATTHWPSPIPGKILPGHSHYLSLLFKPHTHTLLHARRPPGKWTVGQESGKLTNTRQSVFRMQEAQKIAYIWMSIHLQYVPIHLSSIIYISYNVYFH